MTSYKVISAFKQGGQLVEPGGQPVVLDDVTAARLKKAGCVREHAEKASEAPTPEAPAVEKASVPKEDSKPSRRRRK